MNERSYWRPQNRLRRRGFLKGGASIPGALAAASLAGCGSKKPSNAGRTATTAAAKPGGTLTLNLNDNPPSLNLWTEFTYLVARSIAPAYNQLLQVDPMDESKIIPDLAKSWE